MKNILRNNTKLQIFLDWIIYIYRLCFGQFPEPPDYVCPIYINHDRIALKRAVEAFELKKAGGCNETNNK